MKKIIKEVNFPYSLHDINTVAKEIFALKSKCNIYTFKGPLGAGKTTLIKALLKEFGVCEPITSPTFSYVNTYSNKNQETLYHFDIYRLSDIEEFLHAGFDEFLYADKSWAFIEWPELLGPLLQHNVCEVSLDYDVDDIERRIIACKIIQ